MFLHLVNWLFMWKMRIEYLTGKCLNLPSVKILFIQFFSGKETFFETTDNTQNLNVIESKISSKIGRYKLRYLLLKKLCKKEVISNVSYC